MKQPQVLIRGNRVHVISCEANKAFIQKKTKKKKFIRKPNQEDIEKSLDRRKIMRGESKINLMPIQPIVKTQKSCNYLIF